MRIPDRLASLVEHGVIDEVARSLKSGKEADVFVVASGGEWRVAKVYKEAQNRNFQNRAEYTEGRQVRSSRDQRAMAKSTKYGKAQNEEAWQSAEVDMIYRLQGVGIRVPKPHYFIDGVLIMELVANAEGEPAPRLGDLHFTPEEAQDVFGQLVAEVARMLSAGVVHGDLSDFNVLMAADGPVVIDFPQSVNAASNGNARKMLIRDVDNLHRFLQRFVPGAVRIPYAEEMWQLYERGELTSDSKLTGNYVEPAKATGTREVLGLIEDARRDEQKKRQFTGRSMRGTGPEAPRTYVPREQHASGNPRPQHAQGNQPRPQQAQGHQPRPQHAQGNQPRPQHAQGNQPRPQHAQGNQPRPQHAQGNQPRPQHAQGNPRPQHAQGNPRPQHAQGNQPRPQHAQGNPRPPHAQGNPRPQHTPGNPRPPHAQGSPRPQHQQRNHSRPHGERRSGAERQPHNPRENDED